MEMVFHGGYTHNNRHHIEKIVKGKIQAYDFASSYPYCMLAYKFPMERFMPFQNCTPEFILKNSEDYAYIFKLIMIKPRLKNDFIPMPAHFRKANVQKQLTLVEDNGRILCAEYAEIYLNEQDLKIIMQQYSFQKGIMH